MKDVDKLIRQQKFQDRFFAVLGFLCTLVGLVVLSILIIDLLRDGWKSLDYQFLTSFPSRRAESAGILVAWIGSILVAIVTALTAVPLGIAAAIYLEEYARKNWLTSFVEINITNLAGVPSIIYGLMSLGLFVYFLGLGRNVFVGGLTLGFLILPIIIVATREAIRSVPNGIREAAYALGATKWQVIWHHLLPCSVNGIATGTIIALSRALGESAPLIVVGAVVFNTVLPPSPVQSHFPFVNFDWLNSSFSVLPIQVFNWVSRPQESFHRIAAAGSIVLIFITLTLNGMAMFIRYRFRKKVQW
ncbi:MAG: phosphate ABC transporter permease PstA [Planctomycetaceae bacterium]|nr:phosphate ABC transporter permease PstA [Planctomycetaceae bacterium]